MAAAISHNLLRATGVVAGSPLTNALAVSTRQKIINIPARIARRARKLLLHLPTHWKWATAFDRLWNTAMKPPTPAMF